jgi:hypothetical protein
VTMMMTMLVIVTTMTHPPGQGGWVCLKPQEQRRHEHQSTLIYAERQGATVRRSPTLNRERGRHERDERGAREREETDAAETCPCLSWSLRVVLRTTAK